MKQEKIWYDDIMALGFKEQFEEDNMFFNKFGFQYTIITKKLSKGIYLEWAKETQLCEMIRVGKRENIKAKVKIRDLEHAKEMIEFFTANPKPIC